MEKKRLTKYVWYGSDVDNKGNPVLPEVSSSGNHLEGLNRGELFIHLGSTTTLWTVSAKGEIVQVSGVDIEELFKIFLRKDQDDRTPFNLGVGKKITTGEGIESEDFAMGELGNGFALLYNKLKGHSYLEVDELLVRKFAYFVALIIKQLSHVGGTLILSPASMRCAKVDEFSDFYRCYFLAEHEGKSIEQEFVVNDQARSQSFNVKEGTTENAKNQYYWRLVVGVSKDAVDVDGQKYHYIDLSKIDCDESSQPPLVGDDIVQLGHRTNPDRQNAIILSTVGEDAPSFKQYAGIQYYTLAGKEKTVISPHGNTLVGDFKSTNGEDIKTYIDTLGARLDDVQNQTDKSYMIWFFDYEPTLDNYPASEWADDSVKREHVQDMFYNEDSGRAYRFLMPSEGVFVWNEITDHDTLLALKKAAEAKEIADSKIRNFVEQPMPPYEVGDRWSNASYGDLYDNDDLVCINTKQKGESFDIADWKLVTEFGTKKINAEIEKLEDSISLRVTEERANEIVNEAGLRIENNMAKVYAKSADVEYALTVTNQAISMKVSSDNVIASINASKDGVFIDASKINLNGVVTFSMLSKGLQSTIDDKVDESTIISGGYIKTSLIDVDNLFVKNVRSENAYGSLLIEGGSITFYDKNNSEKFSINTVVNDPLLTIGQSNDRSITISPTDIFVWSSNGVTSLNNSGLTLCTGSAVKNLCIGNFAKSTGSLNGTTDFFVGSGTVTLPAASGCKGKVIFVKLTASSTIKSVSSIYRGNEYSSFTSDSYDSRSMFFVSDGNAWYEFTCWYR